MYKKDSAREKKLSITFFLVIFLLGILLFKDYGISSDERFHRNNALFWHDYIESIFKDKTSFESNGSIKLIENSIKNNNDIISGVPSIQSVSLPIIYEFLLDFTNIKDSKEIYQYRHLYNFIIFFLGLIFFYKLIKKTYKSYFFSLIGCVFLFLTPRFFSESFYNPQDIFFLSLTIINMYTGISFLKKPSLKRAITFSLSSALCIDTRILGFISFFLVLIFFFFKLLRSKKFVQNYLKFLFYIVSFTFFTIVLFWPFLWASPFKNLFFALSELSSVKFLVTNFYFGQYISSISIPWHFHLVWIGITSPIIILILLFLGLFFIFRRLFFRLIQLNDNLNDIWRGDKEMSEIYFLLMVILPIYLSINQGMGYSSWRHLYFIYPSIIMIALSGIYYFNIFIKNKFFKLPIYGLILINLLYLANWIYQNHPYQYVYFNLISKNKINNFDKDYWGLSNKNALDYIIENNKVFPVKVATKSFASLETSSLILDENEKKKIEIVYDYEEADFIITNYTKRLRGEFIVEEDRYTKFYEILVDGIPINTIYKKKK